MRPPLLVRIRWWFEDLLEASPLSRVLERVEEVRAAPVDGRVVLGSLLVVVLLVGGGFAAARAVAGGSGGEAKSSAIRVVTTRQLVRVKVHGHVVTQWRTRRLYAKARTVMQTATIHTPYGIKVVRRPVTRYQVVYRKRRTTTLSQPVTDVRTLTNTSTRTQLVTATDHVTDTQTITQPVTVAVTTTVVSTETDTLPVTVTITVPAG